MISRLLGLIGVSILAGCGGSGSNPITGGPITIAGAEVDPNDPTNDSAGVKFAFDVDQRLILNGVTFDPMTNELVLENLPFDQNNYEQTLALPGGFALYENVGRADPGNTDYFAVFQQSGTGFSLAGAVQTADLAQGEDFAGAIVRRLSGSSTLPAQIDPLVYTGPYAGTQVDRRGPGRSGAKLVTGDANITIDFFDPNGGIINDNTAQGAIRGVIRNRQLLNTNGTQALDKFGRPITLTNVGMATTSFDRTTNAISDQTSAQAGSFDALLSGEWSGIVSGPNGEEFAGYIVLTGSSSQLLSDPDPNDLIFPDPRHPVREIGVFIGTKQP